MDLAAGADIAAKWAATSYELHTAAANWSHDVDRRVKEELASLLLTEKDWEGGRAVHGVRSPR